MPNEPSAKERRQNLINEIDRLKRELDNSQNALNTLIRSCKHQWEDPVYDPIRHEGYTDPGNPPGTMGVDWRGPCYVPPSTTPRWKRTCKICGHTEFTTRSTDIVTKAPSF